MMGLCKFKAAVLVELITLCQVRDIEILRLFSSDFDSKNKLT